MEQVKTLREKTGAGIVEVKKALEEAAGNEEAAVKILREKGATKAVKKSAREAKEGIVAVYLHSNNKVAAMVKLLCETDFVARNEDFKALGRDIAMHVAAMSPSVVRPEDISEEAVAKERDIWMEQLKNEGKPAEIQEKILAGKEKKFREEGALLTQAFVKNPEQTVEAVITEHIHKIGENIVIGEFVRYEL